MSNENITEQFGNVSTGVHTSNCKHLSSYISFKSFDDVVDVWESKKFESAGTEVFTSHRKHETSCASNILPNGIDTEDRLIAGIDWSRFEIIVNVKDKFIEKFKTLAEAAPHYKGFIWVMESTADSFELQNRQIDLDAIKVNNIRAYCFNPKYTSKYRIKWNDIIKSDEADSEVIRRIFTETKITCVSFKQLIKNDELRESIQNDLIKDRQYGGEISVNIAKKYLPSFKDVPENLREFLYEPNKSKNPKNRKPKKQIGRLLIAAEKVREKKLGFRTFRRQIGNYGQGYGCMIRSEYYHWLIRIITNARLKKDGIEKNTKDSHHDPKTKELKKVHIPTEKEDEIRKEVMREMAGVLKWLWKLTDKNLKDVSPKVPTNFVGMSHLTS